MTAVRRPELNRRPLADGTAFKIAQLARDTDGSPDGTLPPLSALATQLGVSRAVVRQAVMILAEQGVVEKTSSRRWRTVTPVRSKGGARPARLRHVRGAAIAGDADRESLAEQVADRVIAMIVDRNLREGDPLPSTGELADEFGASLVVIREALAALASQGVLLRRQGRQTTVARPSFESLSSVLRLRAHLEGISLDEFLVCREALEVEASALAAAAEGPDRKLAALKPHLDGMRAAQSRSRAEFNIYDMGFHLQVADLSENRAIGFILSSLNDVVRAGLLARYDRLQLRAGEPGIGLSVEHHQAIADAIVNGDVAAAIAAMRAHFRFVDLV